MSQDFKINMALYPNIGDLKHFYCAVYRGEEMIVLKKLFAKLQDFTFLPDNSQPIVGHELYRIPKRYYNNSLRKVGIIKSFSHQEITCAYGTKNKTRIVDRAKSFCWQRKPIPEKVKVNMIAGDSSETSEISEISNDDDKLLIVLED